MSLLFLSTLIRKYFKITHFNLIQQMDRYNPHKQKVFGGPQSFLRVQGSPKIKYTEKCCSRENFIKGKKKKQIMSLTNVGTEG